MRPIVFAGSFVLSAIAAGCASANEFSSVTSEAEFVSLVAGKQLTRFGIALDVSQDGRIRGRAFGQAVSGDWQWNDGLFCRDLIFGERDLGPNCQVVKTDGETIRFIADRGAGDYADFGLK